MPNRTRGVKWRGRWLLHHFLPLDFPRPSSNFNSLQHNLSTDGYCRRHQRNARNFSKDTGTSAPTQNRSSECNRGPGCGVDWTTETEAGQQVCDANHIRVINKSLGAHAAVFDCLNICVLFVLFFYIYAVLGVELFGSRSGDEHKTLQQTTEALLFNRRMIKSSRAGDEQRSSALEATGYEEGALHLFKSTAVLCLINRATLAFTSADNLGKSFPRIWMCSLRKKV
ncbi:hypothetical protein EYF80_030634 [Liparis tanakae]|uniref:Uncharacterized protein n=1 Tax=Liparis tanakae TaxID=230148 RepID=A0A4Z2H2Z4_9TELE|nr:hypothetical protein EYF80_030634 [Liparis tanakae]